MPICTLPELFGSTARNAGFNRRTRDPLQGIPGHVGRIRAPSIFVKRGDRSRGTDHPQMTADLVFARQGGLAFQNFYERLFHGLAFSGDGGRCHQ